MNKNQENYKNAINQIHVDENLKNEVLKKAKSQKKNNSLKFLQFASGLAAVAVVAFVGVSIYHNNMTDVLNPDKEIVSQKDYNKINLDQEKALEKLEIKRFASIDELRDVLEKAEENSTRNGMTKGDLAFTNDSVPQSEGISDSVNSSTQERLMTNSDYSRTNNQVESVDEADIVKTDGEYIYYVTAQGVYIVEASSLEEKAKIEDKDEKYSVRNVFINNNKLVLLGNYYDRVDTYYSDIEEGFSRNYIDTIPRTFAKVEVYDISNKSNPKKEREICLEGYYTDARMIDDNIYFISSRSFSWYRPLNELKDDELLPKYSDSSISSKEHTINVTDIAYFENSEDYAYSIIGGFNLNNNDEVKVETFFGFGSDLYVSEKNMYVVQTKYNQDWTRANSIIYKFKLNNGNVIASAKGEVPGYINDQFSIDEYEDNLRIVTTIDEYDSNLLDRWRLAGDYTYTTQLTVLDENLNQIGVIENLKKDERVYSVRFIGKVGYVVTFEQVDPLFVIDLSDPRNPVVKGELEIPGYSSYLHPIDETHIIGIGYNTKDNGYGGVTNDSMKMSMFDVSDLSNPKEIFKINIGKNYAYSNILYDHKALFYKASDNLIGFPVQWYDRIQYSGMALYQIDLENNQFIEITDIMEKGYDAYDNIQRAIYIDDTLYTLSYDEIIAYDLNTFKKISTLELDHQNRYYIDDEYNAVE